MPSKQRLTCGRDACTTDTTDMNFYELIEHANDVHHDYFHRKEDYAYDANYGKTSKGVV